jgi:hypothetical protein
MAKTRDDDVLVGAVRAEKDAVTGLDHMVTTHESHVVRMPVHVTVEGRDDHPLPKGWRVIHPSDRLLDLVARHGLSSERLAAAPRAPRPRPHERPAHRSRSAPSGTRAGDLTGSDAERELELSPARSSS